MADTRTRAQKLRAANQDSEREHLRTLGLIQYALECVEKMKIAEDTFELSKWDKVADKYINLSKRYLPELKAVELSGSLDIQKDAAELDDALLARIAAAGSTGITEQTGSKEEPTSVH